MDRIRESAASNDHVRLSAALHGDVEAWGALLNELHPRLIRMAALRLDRRLKGRLDPADVVQEAFLEATRRREEFVRDPSPGLLLWVRFLTLQQLQLHHRRHLGVRARDAAREISIDGPAMPEATSAVLAARLLGHDTSPSSAFARAERKRLIQETLESMDPIDREILVLRHFEELTADESARALGISCDAASKRFIRAMKRLKGLIGAMPDSGEGLRS